MTCVCEVAMQLIDVDEDYEWVDDSPRYKIQEQYECMKCGMVATVDATDTICENPF